RTDGGLPGGRLRADERLYRRRKRRLAGAARKVRLLPRRLPARRRIPPRPLGRQRHDAALARARRDGAAAVRVTVGAVSAGAEGRGKCLQVEDTCWPGCPRQWKSTDRLVMSERSVCFIAQLP